MFNVYRNAITAPLAPYDCNDRARSDLGRRAARRSNRQCRSDKPNRPVGSTSGCPSHAHGCTTGSPPTARWPPLSQGDELPLPLSLRERREPLRQPRPGTDAVRNVALALARLPDPVNRQFTATMGFLRCRCRWWRCCLPDRRSCRPSRCRRCCCKGRMKLLAMVTNPASLYVLLFTTPEAGASFAPRAQRDSAGAEP